ncbi:MAG: PspA/IM30 family protein [Gammaproteobacteria bacterium]|nr:PspA/IM30 family protein [Gammaproteobacteria bacterium]
MTESISARVGRLISGTTNMLVEKVENLAPEVVMQQAIREVEGAIDDVRHELGKTLSKQHMASRRLADESQKHAETSEKVQLALDNDREDLAETAIAMLLDIETQIPILESTIAESKESVAEYEGYIAALQARKREMEEELNAFREAKSTTQVEPGSSDASGTGAGSSVGDNVRDAERAFDRAMRGAGGISSASDTPDQHTAAKRAELEDLSRKNRIKERLQAFRSNND